MLLPCFAAENISQNACLNHSLLHREENASALLFDGFDPIPVGLGWAAHNLLHYTPSCWGSIKRDGECHTRRPWPLVTTPTIPLPPSNQDRAHRHNRRGRITRSQSRADSQQQFTFAHIPEISTAIPIITTGGFGPSTIDKTVEQGEGEREGREENRLRVSIASIADQYNQLSNSSGYSPSPDREMPLHPVSLLAELNLAIPPSRGGTSRAPPVTTSTVPSVVVTSIPSQQQRDKRPVDIPLDI